VAAAAVVKSQVLEIDALVLRELLATVAGKSGESHSGEAHVSQEAPQDRPLANACVAPEISVFTKTHPAPCVFPPPAPSLHSLNPLAQTGGLPGLDAVNEVVIQRGYFQDALDRDGLLRELEARPPDCSPYAAAAGQGGQTIRIPLRLRPGEVPSIRPEDIILHTGDIVFIEAREAEFFYTGGLLPAGQFVVPRDYDLDVVQAISLVAGPLVSGGLNPINLSGAFLAIGIGAPSPTLVSVIRRTPGGGQVVIRVDLNVALRDPRERILIQPRDVIVLQETPSEALVRYLTQVFRFNFVWQAIHGPHETGTGTANAIVP